MVVGQNLYKMVYFCPGRLFLSTEHSGSIGGVLEDIAPDKDWRQLGIYLPLFGLIGYFKF